MDLFGNPALLDRYLVSFLSSRDVDDEAVSHTRRWAARIILTDKVVISGFHSPLERDLLRILLANRHPVIVVLGRSIYRRLPAGFSEAIADDNMLLISVRNYVRQSVSSAQIRNWYVTEIADEMVFAGIHAGSSLNVLCDMRRSEGRPTEIF